ncbi:hypothetical protein E2C01_028877 [Portunus trituberculatus]|uniref:Uncharacterized protein n=1 Tax=Portunus trituberculatus TaxID=210409 RepID=A0A5B7ER87_PORTR|nr:hypothetical protein [Portunus trituberculatus]
MKMPASADVELHNVHEGVMLRGSVPRSLPYLMSKGVPGGSRSSVVNLVVGLRGRKAKPNTTQLREVQGDKECAYSPAYTTRVHRQPKDGIRKLLSAANIKVPMPDPHTAMPVASARRFSK